MPKKMKKLIPFILFAALLTSCGEPEPTLAPDEYRITVNAKGVYNGIRGYLGQTNSRRNFIGIDTAMVVNEQLVFTGKVDHISLKELSINGINNSLQFILEPGVTNITVYKDSIQKSIVDGGQNNTDFQNYLNGSIAISDEIRDLRNQANKARRAENDELYKKLSTELSSKNKAFEDYYGEFIAKNPNSDFSLLLLQTKLTNNNDNVDLVASSLKHLENVIEKNQRNKDIGQQVKSFLTEKEALKNVEIGKIAPEFSGPTPDGKTLALSDVKGKATIVDFWAAWCGPCRRENPNVVRVYEKYKDKGLEIIGVSLDRPNQKQRWLDAIAKDNLTWHHVSHLQYFNDPIARQYSVNSIPAMFVLDEEGRIVAKKLRGQALEDQIASMLD